MAFPHGCYFYHYLYRLVIFEICVYRLENGVQAYRNQNDQTSMVIEAFYDTTVHICRVVLSSVLPIQYPSRTRTISNEEIQSLEVVIQ